MSTVLIIEDSKTQAENLAAHLSQYAVDIMIAEDGPDGLDMAYRNRPDIIILDIHLPTMDGYQVCRRLKRDDATAYIPVIMLTSADHQTDIDTGYNVGADGYIPKGTFAIPYLLSTLERMGIIQQGASAGAV